MGQPETLAKRVKRLRDAKNWSQARLAKESTVAAGTIGDIEQGKQFTAGRKIDLLADALGVSAKYLRTGEDSPSPALTESSLSPRETRLIERFRLMTDRSQERLEDFAGGLPIKKRIAPVKQTAQEIRGAKSRRSG